MDLDLPPTFVKEFHDEEEVKKMKYSTLPSTDLRLSVLGVGGGPLGNVYGQIEENDGITVVKEAFKHGVNYIDTAPFYGITSSETLIGKALVGVPREAYYISTKVGRYGAHDFDYSADRIEKEFEKSLERLGLDYVDIVFVHDVEFCPLQQLMTETLPTVQRLVDKKKARYIGISAYPVSLLWEVIEKSSVKINVIISYARDCLFDATMKTYSSFIEAHNVGMIHASLTGMGLLTNGGPPEWHPASQEVKEMCHNASLYCKDQGVELGKLAVYHGMQKQYHTSHLVGMKSVNELMANLEVATVGLNEHELKVLNEVKQKFFSSGQNYHWEGVELAEHHRYMKNNIPK